jgi:hypothetical protein
MMMMITHHRADLIPYLLKFRLIQKGNKRRRDNDIAYVVVVVVVFVVVVFVIVFLVLALD